MTADIDFPKQSPIQTTHKAVDVALEPGLGQITWEGDNMRDGCRVQPGGVIICAVPQFRLLRTF